MKRRDFVKKSSYLLGTLPFLSFIPSYTLHPASTMTGDIHKIKIGTFQCTLFRDLMFKYRAKDYFINAPEKELSLMLDKHNIQPDNIPSPFIAVLLQQGNKKILIDTGIGYASEPLLFRGNTYSFKGRLIELLEGEGIKGDDITDVVLTHFHPDHIGGVYHDKGAQNFPNARHHVHEKEWNFWYSSLSEKQPPLFRHFIEKNVDGLKQGNLNLIKGDFVEVLPGVTAVLAEGHTPGQIALIIHSGSEQLLYTSDAFLHPIHLEKLDWQTNYDFDHGKAKQSRTKLLDLAQKENMLVNAFHFDFPGLGHVQKYQDKWTWNPVNA